MTKKKPRPERKQTQKRVAWDWARDEATAKVKTCLDSKRLSTVTEEKPPKPGFNPYDKDR